MSKTSHKPQVIREGRGYVIEDRPDGDQVLVVADDWSQDAATEVLRGVDALELNYARGFRERNLNFVEGLPVRRLLVLSRTLKDVSPIEFLGNSLERLQLQVSPSA